MRTRVVSIYVWLHKGKRHVANVLRNDGSYRTYNLTSHSYFRLEKVCKYYSQLDSIRNRIGGTKYSLIINRV